MAVLCCYGAVSVLSASWLQVCVFSLALASCVQLEVRGAPGEKLERADANFMDVRLSCQPSYTLAYCFLEAGESVWSERGAMAALSAGITVGSGFGRGGVSKALLRKEAGGESLFMTKFTADVHGAWVALAPKYPGDIQTCVIKQGEDLLIQTGSMLGHSDGLAIDVKWAGVRNVVLREGATVLRVHGDGEVLLASYGGLQRFELAEEEEMIVDTGHLVAYGIGVSIKLGMLGGARVAAMSGEGIVARLAGPGPVFIQTRAEQGLVSWLAPGRRHDSGS